MQDQYINKNIDEIVKDKNYKFPQNIAMVSAWILGNLKGINLKVMNVKGISSLADFFVLGSATNRTQAQAMANELLKQTKRLGLKTISKEGMDNADWILIDMGDIIVHIFLETSRMIYDLDALWREAKQEEIPQSYYFSNESLETSGTGKDQKDPLKFF